MSYNFEEARHIHTLDGKPLMGVTTVLAVIAKPALIQWSANMACDYIINESPLIESEEETLSPYYEVQLDILKEARSAHRKKKESAGDWGTNIHKAIEEWIKEKKEPQLDEKGMEVFNKFKEWAIKEKVKFLESEKHVYSEKYWIGGILDGVCLMDNKKYIFDVKTSSGIYPEMWSQMGAYHLCLLEMDEHKDIEGYLIVNLKKTGEIDFGMSNEVEFNQEFFKATLNLYKLKQKADNSI